MAVLDVACAVEGRYVPHSAAMLLSVLDGGRGHEVRIHYLHGPGFPRRARDRLAAMVAAAGGSIAFVEVADERVAGLPDAGYFTKAMWYRTFLPDLLPGVARVLYLDVDTLALDEIAPLWDVEFGDGLVAAVTNVFEPWGERWPVELGLAGPTSYFNSGVLMMNLDGMRAEHVAERLRRHAIDHADDLYWPDQDALNVILDGRRVALHPRWNVMNNVMLRERAVEVFGGDEIHEARTSPAIRHFEGPSVAKPWHYGSRMAHRERYFEYRRRTPWPRGRLDGLPPLAVVERVRQYLTPMRPV